MAGDDAHRLERADFLRHLRHLLDAELEGDLAVVDDAVAAAQRRVHLLDRREVELREHTLILRSRGGHLRAATESRSAGGQPWGGSSGQAYKPLSRELNTAISSTVQHTQQAPISNTTRCGSVPFIHAAHTPRRAARSGLPCLGLPLQVAVRLDAHAWSGLG